MLLLQESVIIQMKDVKILFFVKEEVNTMSGNKHNIMSENLKEEIAKELGVYEVVKRDGGWGNVSSQTCGNIVSKAIEIANRSVEK